MKKFTVSSFIDLKDFTDCTYPQGSFYLSALLRASDVRVNGVKVNKNVRLKPGDEVAYYTTPKQEQKPSHSVIYADEFLLAADKESGVSTEALACELGLNPVHRLDRNTSGLIVFAKTAEAEERLLKAFKERTVSKEYICAVKSCFKKECGICTAYLRKNSSEGRVEIFASQKSDCVKIITEYEVLQKCGDCALVNVRLHTGKTHQIRAHMAYLGCPVLGDEKYGDESFNKKYGVKRQMLVSKRMAFTLFNKNYKLESPRDIILSPAPAVALQDGEPNN